MHKRTLIITLIALATLLLAGCDLQFNTNIKPNGSGAVRIEFGYTAFEEQQIVTELIGEDPSSSLCGLFKEEPGSGILQDIGGTITEERRGNQTWCVTNIPFSNLNELNYIYTYIQIAEVQNLEYTEEGNLFYLVNMESVGADVNDFEELGIAYTAAWKLTVPGTPGENNADRVNGRTLTWDLEPGRQYRFYAESSPTSWTIWLIYGGLGLCLCLMAIVIVAVIIFVAMRRTKK